MHTDGPDPLSRREREIMNIVYRLEQASVSEVLEAMDDAPSYSTVRALMGTLEKKGQLTHSEEGTRYLYRPVVAREVAQRSALARIVQNLFGGEPERAAVTLLEMSGLHEDKLEELRALVAAATEEGR